VSVSNLFQIERIDNFGRFSELRSAWSTVYAKDPGATVFLSWEWLSAFLLLERQPWSILALKTGDCFHAFLPLATAPFPPRGARLGSELSLAANPMADYTGFLADPAIESEAVLQFADYIRTMRWEVFYLRDVLDPRLLAVANHLDAANFSTRSLGFVTICPYLELGGGGILSLCYFIASE
jgi:hypothetical protein